MAEGYEYRGLIADAWDLLRGDTSSWPDRGFYRRIIDQSGQPVLDVGCGTGRLLLDYLQQGLDIDGVDVSSEMMDLCRSKAKALGLIPRLYEQHMEQLELPRKYRTIIVPSSSFQLVINEEAAAQAMARFHDHLEPGGTLVMPFLVLSDRDSTDGEWFSVEATRPEDGALVRRRARSRYDAAAQLEDTEDIYEVLVHGRVVASEHFVRSPATRDYTVAQARAAFEAAGFGVQRVVSGFTDEDYREGDHIFTILGVRP